jgi:hypothetical protein
MRPGRSSAARAHAVEDHERLADRAAVGVETLRDQEPHAREAVVLPRGRQGSVDAARNIACDLR